MSFSNRIDFIQFFLRHISSEIQKFTPCSISAFCRYWDVTSLTSAEEVAATHVATNPTHKILKKRFIILFSMINITHWLYIFDNQPHISPNPLQIYVKKTESTTSFENTKS